MVLVALIGGFTYGLLVGAWRIFPFDWLRQAKVYLGFAYYDSGGFDRTNLRSEAFVTDSRTLITIRSQEAVAAKRIQIIRLLWKAPGLPLDRLPQRVIRSVSQDRLVSADLARTDRLEYVMDHGIDSVIHVFHPKTPNKRLAIYHNGHGTDPTGTIAMLLGHGYTVLDINMPLFRPNSQPVVTLPGFGPTQLVSHNQLSYLQTPGFHPIKVFLEPVTVALNYMQRQAGFREAIMVGLSGGGWTTTLYAALDPRITTSIPVAGTLPLHLRSAQLNEFAEWESTAPSLYSIANYLDLYVMGAAGPGRSQLQILNEYDSCCFAGLRSRLYDAAVREAVATVGTGKFQTFLDRSHAEHKISHTALTRIEQELALTH